MVDDFESFQSARWQISVWCSQTDDVDSVSGPEFLLFQTQCSLQLLNVMFEILWMTLSRNIWFKAPDILKVENELPCFASLVSQQCGRVGGQIKLYCASLSVT